MAAAACIAAARPRARCPRLDLLRGQRRQRGRGEAHAAARPSSADARARSRRRAPASGPCRGGSRCRPASSAVPRVRQRAACRRTPRKWPVRASSIARWRLRRRAQQRREQEERRGRPSGTGRRSTRRSGPAGTGIGMMSASGPSRAGTPTRCRARELGMWSTEFSAPCEARGLEGRHPDRHPPAVDHDHERVARDADERERKARVEPVVPEREQQEPVGEPQQRDAQRLHERHAEAQRRLRPEPDDHRDEQQRQERGAGCSPGSRACRPAGGRARARARSRRSASANCAAAWGPACSARSRPGWRPARVGGAATACGRWSAGATRAAAR